MAALIAGTGSAAAQDATSQVERYWGAWGEIGAQAGTEAAAFLEGFMPVGQDGDSLVFLDLRLDYGENARGSMSVGFGARELVSDNLVIGANAFVDVVRTENSEYHLGATVGLEAFTSIFDLRLNAHIPLGGKKVLDSRTVTTGVNVVGNQLVEQRAQIERTEGLLYGLTGELGALFDSPFSDNQKLRTYVGGYVYDRGGYKMETGARLGLEYQINDALGLSGSRLTLGAELVYDKDDELDAIASARFRMPLYAGRTADGEETRSRLSPIRERMAEGIRRDKGIRSATRAKSNALASIPVVNPTTGRVYGGIYYANRTGSGTGSFIDPTSLSAAITSAGTDGIVVVLGDDGTVTTTGLTMQSGQLLLGGGESVAVRLSSGLTTNFLTSGTAGTIDGDPGITTVTLADEVVVRGLTLQGGATVIGGNNVSDVTLSNLSIQNATDGVSITGATNASLSGLTFTGITGTSIFLNNEAATLSNITIDGGTNGISIANNTGTTRLSTINISNVTGDALSFANNGGIINVSNLTATNTGDDAVAITGGGAFNFAGSTTIDGLGAGASSDGFDLSGTTGATITTSHVDITGLGGGTGLNLAGGDATLTMASLDITGTNVAGSRGIDLSGTQNGRTVTITTGGNISGVDTGIVLGTNGAAGAAADAIFTFGGGMVAGNVFALDGIGVLSGTGSYGFGTTAFTGAFNFDISSTQNFYVSASGTGDGSSTSNAASIATAIAQAGGLGAVNFILINDGSAIDTSGLTFTLANGQSIDTFGEGRTFTEAGYLIPLNITGDNLPTGGVTITDPTGLGAATLTNSSGGVATLSLANGNAVRNITVGNAAGNAISGSGIAGVTLSGVTSTAGISLANTSGSVILTDVSVNNGSGTGLSLSGNAGTVTGTNVDITGVNSLAVSGGNAAITFDADSSVDNTGGTAVEITGRIGGSFSHFGSISSNGGTASGITIAGATAASNVTFGGLVSLGTTTALGGGSGLSLDNNGQSSAIAFTGGLDIVTAGFDALSATGGGSLQVTGGSLSATGGSAATIGGIATDVTFSSVASSGAAGDALSLALGTGSSFTVTGATTLSGMGGDGIDLSGSTGGSFSFGDVDVTGLDAGTGLNLAGGDATLTMSSLDVTGTGTAGSRGIDISGTQNGRTVTITNGGTISDVATGVVLGTNGAAGAAPSANFTFGGGSISGSNYALDGIGVNAGDGTYAFGSTAFTGGFNFAVSLSNNYYVAATATGTGDGSSTDNRASIATAIAMASTLGTVNFVLINDGSAIDTGGLTFTLDDGQTVDTFGGGRSFTESGFIIPANITGTNLPAPGTTVSDPTGFGAATLTNTGGGGATLALANGNAIRNIIIGSSAGNAVSGSGIAGVTISGVTSTAGIDLTSTTGAVTLTNLAISNTSGPALSLAGIAGTVTGTNVDITGVNSLAVSGGNGAISFDADSSVTNSSGTAVTITGRVGGSFSHFGSISSNGGTASGITISGATGANSVTFGGQVSLGTTTALTSVGVNVDNAGTASTVAFDGGLQVVTSAAAALAGTGGGTLRISDAGTETLSATDAMALSLSGMAVDITLDEVNAINANMTSVLLQNLDGSLAVNGGALSTVVSGASFNSFNVIQNDGTATRSLALAVDNLTIIHDASGATVAPSEHGLVVTTSGDDSAVVAISNSTFQTEDSGVRLIGNNGLITVTDFADNTLLGSATAFDPNLFANGMMFQGVTFDADLSTAGLQAVNGGTFTAGAPGLAVNHGLFFDSTASANVGRIDFTNYNVNAVNQALSLGSSNPGLTVGIADGEVTAGLIRLGTGFGVANGDITLSSLTLSSQLSANQFAGSFAVTGTTTINAPETVIDFGGTYSRTSTTGISVMASSGAFNFNTLTVASVPGANTTTGGATVGLALNGNSGTFTVTGTTTISDTVEDAIRITDTSGAISFGRTVISNPHATPIVAGTPIPAIEARSAAVDISGTITGDISFADLEIVLNSADSTGVELTGATINATVSADTFTVSGNGSTGTVAVDLRDALGGGTVRLGDSAASGSSSSISGVNTGVFLNSNTNLDFTYGDGEDAVDTGSTISATVAIDAASAPVAGTYNFRDVAFSTSPGNGFSVGRIYFVDADGAIGGGDGSGSDASNPMTLAAAEAAIGAGDIIVLINNGDAITAAATNANDTLNLLDNVQLLSFGDGAGGSQTVAVNITAPPTILLSAAGISIADPTGNGAATLTTSAGNDVVTLGSTGNRLSGLILEGNGTATRGIVDSGGASNTVIERSLVSNFSTYGIEITPSTNTTIDGVTFSGNTGDVLLNAANSTLRNITSTGSGANGSITLNNTTGTTTLENISITSGVQGLTFNNAGGTINATNVDVAGTSTNAIAITGSTADFNFDATSSIDITSGGVLTMDQMGGGSFTHAGTVVANGISSTGISSNNATGAYTVSFTGTVDFGSTTSMGGSGLSVNNNGQAGTFNFANLILDIDGGAGIVLQGGGSLGIASGSIDVTNGQAVNLGTASIAAGGINLDSLANTNSGGVGINMLSVSGGAFTVSGSTTVSGTTGAAVLLANVASNVSLGAVDLTLDSGIGLLLNNNSGTLTTGDMTIAMGTGGNGIHATNTNGTITFGNVDITGVGASATGLNLSGGSFDGEITFATLDITGTGQSGSRGIDLTDYDNSQDVVTTGSGTIQGVQFGVDLTNANIADGVRFQYGDGSAPVASTIDTSAVLGNIAIVTTGLSATGEYDFEDVGFATSNIANLQGANFFVVDTNATSGAGTFSDPGTIAQAQASGADVIVLVDATTGGVREIIDLGGSSLNLATGQALLGMAGGDSVDVTTLGISAGGVPASLLLTGISSSSVITAPGTFDTVVPILTSSSGSGTVVLAGTATIQNVFIANSGTGSGISANFGTASTATIRSSTIGSGTGAYAVDISTTSGSSSAVLSNLTLTGGLRLNGSAGGALSASATGTNTITSSQTAALTLDTVATDIGSITFDQITSTGDAAGMSLDGISGTGGITIQNASFNRSGTTTTDVVALTDLTMTGALTVANLDIDSTNTQSFAGVQTTGTSTSTINIGTGANGVTIDDTQFGLIFNGSHGTVNVGTAGAGLQIASRSTAISFNNNSTGTFEVGHAGTTSAIAVNAGSSQAYGISYQTSDATVTVTNIDINGTGTHAFSNGIQLVDNDALGSFTLAGTNTIDATGGSGVVIQNANASISGLTLGASATGAGDDISGDGISITGNNAISNTVTLTDIVMGAGGNGDTGDIAGRGLAIISSGSGVLTVDLSGTNTIRATADALFALEIGGGTANNFLISIDNTIFETGSNLYSVTVVGQVLSPTASSVNVRSFANNTVIGNGTGAGILFQGVDFDSDGAGTAVAGGTLNIGQGTGSRVNDNGLWLFSTIGELGFTTLNIFNDNGTGLLVDTKSGGFNTVFTLNGGGSGTVDTTNGTALFLDPLTMDLSFGTVNSTNAAGSGVYVEGGNATAAGNNALTIGTLNVTGSGNAGLLITNSVGTFNFYSTMIDNAGTGGGGIDIDVDNGDTLNVNFIDLLDIDTSSGTGLDVQSSGGSTVTMQASSVGTMAINTATGRIINTSNLLAGASGINFDTLAASGTVTGNAISLDLDAGTFSGGAFSVAGTTGGHGALVSGNGGSISFDSATISNVTSGASGIVDQHLGSVTFTTVDISNSEAGVFTTGIGTLNILGGTISVTGLDGNDRGVWIGGGNGTTNIAADITQNGVGQAVYLHNVFGGTTTFSGDVTFSGGGANGITAENNTGGTVTFSGLSTLATGANTAVQLIDNSGATINFTGGLDIDTTSGTGFSATGGGTVSVSGGTRTINTATGQGVVMNSVAVGAGDIFFNTVAASGTSSGNFVDLQNVSGGTFRVANTSVLNVNGAGVRIANSSADFIFNGFTLGDISTPGSMTYGIDLDGNSGSFTTTASSIIYYAQDAGIRITNAQSTFEADFQAQMEVANRNDATYTAGGDGLLLQNNNAASQTTFTSFVHTDFQRNTGPGTVTASGQGINADTGGILTILGGGISTNNALGAGVASIDIRNTTTNITLNSVSVDNDDAGESGGGIYLENNTGSFTLGAASQFGTSGSTSLYANNAGTVTLGNVSAINIASFGGGRALDIRNTAMNITLGTINNPGSPGSAIRLSDGTSGSLTTGNVSLSNAAGTGPTILISDLVAGSSVTFGGSAAITSGVNTAVSLANNAGSSINFTNGGLNINTTSGTGFQATGGGTVTVTGTGNTVATGTGTAVRFVNTSFGAAGVTFESINTNGAVNGIVLDNTGLTGGFAVTGSGSILGSGGTIQNSTGSGIMLTNTYNVALTNLDVTTTGIHGIHGSVVSNLDLTRVRITSAGNAVDENGIFLQNLRGTAAEGLDSRFDSVIITGAADVGIEIANSTATASGDTSNPDLLTIVNSTISNSGVIGLLAQTSDATSNLRIDMSGSTLTNNPSRGVAANANNGSLQLNLTGGNQLVPGGGGTQFVGVAGTATGSGQLFFNIAGNTITQAGTAGTGPAIIALNANDAGRLQGTISGNTLTTTTAAGTPIDGIAVTNSGSGNNAVTIQNNSITINDGFGIFASGRDAGTGRLDVRVLDNTINVNGTDIANTGIDLRNQGTVGQTVCFHVQNNAISTAPFGNGDIVIENSVSGTFLVQGLGGTFSEPSDFNPDTQPVEIFLSSQQASVTTGTFINPFSASTTFGSAVCNTPIVP